MTLSTLEVLKGARALIEKPENWTTEADARDPQGYSVFGYSDDAVCWCAFGALQKVTGEKMPFEAAVPLTKAAGRGIEWFNDTHTHAEVLALFDRAIASTAEAE